MGLVDMPGDESNPRREYSRSAPSRSPKSVGRIAPSLGEYGDHKHFSALGEYPQSCISIHRCYKRYRDGAMRGA